MRITLIHLPDCYEHHTGRSARYPMGVAYIAAALLEAGHRVQILDFKFFLQPLALIDKQLQAIQADVIGLGGMISSYQHLKDISHRLKHYHPHVPLILGGPMSFTIEPLLLQHSPLDAICMGEGEKTIVELVAAIEKGSSWESVPGLCLPDRGKCFYTPPRPLIDNLDTIPFPAWNLVDPLKYRFDPLNAAQLLLPMNLLASRGCPASCDFCARVVPDRTIRYRSVENVIAEIRILYCDYGLREFTFVDEYLTADIRWLKQLCQRLIAEDLRISWYASSRVRLFDDETYDLIQASGCRCLTYGFESGDPEILKHYNKRQKPQQAWPIYQQLSRRGIKMNYMLLAGAFMETEATVAATVQTLLPQATAARMYFLTPLPGTPIYRQAIEKGLIRDVDAYLTDVSLIDNSFETIPTLNLTRYPLETWVAIKQTAETDTSVMHILRNVVGVCGEFILQALLQASPSELLQNWPSLRQAWQSYIEQGRYLKGKYPEVPVDPYFYTKSPLAAPLASLPAPLSVGELPVSVILDYFLTHYGLLGETFLARLYALTETQVQQLLLLYFPTWQELLQRDFQLFLYLCQQLQGEFLKINQEPSLSASEIARWLPQSPEILALWPHNVSAFNQEKAALIAE